MKHDQLAVAEIFYSIQGEGPTTGIPSVFLRLAGCNLLCQGAGWTCDSIEVWKKGTRTPLPEVLPEKFIKRLKDGAHLVITGGEPLLQQAAIVNYIDYLREKYEFWPVIEVETNGTIVPCDKLLELVTHWNVSPKLANSGESYERRVNNVALLNIVDRGQNYMFKFVICQEEDLIGMFEEYDFLPKSSFVLMPAGDSMTEGTLARNRQKVVEICKELGFRFSDRTHITLWNKKTGV